MGDFAFNKEHYEQIAFKVKKGWSTAPREAAKRLRLSFTKYVQMAVEEKLHKTQKSDLVFPSASKRRYRVVLRDKDGKAYHRETFAEKDLLRTDDKGALRFVANHESVLTLKIRSFTDALNNQLSKINDFIADIEDTGGAKILADELMEKFFKSIVYTPSEGYSLSDLIFVALYQDAVDPSVIICSDKRLIVQYLYNEINLNNFEEWTIEEKKGEDHN